MKLRRVLLVVLAVLLLAAAVGYVARVPLSLALAGRVAVQKMGSDPAAELPDGLHVGLCGAGSPFPDDLRAGPCTVVLAGKRLFVFDSGAGSVRNIGRFGFSHGKVEAIFLTHLHSDHIDGLGELLLQRWVSASNSVPVPMYGPEGVQTIVAGLMQAYTPDRGYRVAHHGEKTVPSSGFGAVPHAFDIGPTGRVVVLKDADLEVVAFTVDHAPVHPAVGYRIQYKGRAVVLSGDTRPSPAVVREATGVDLLVHEALSVPMVGILKTAAGKTGRANLQKIFDDILDYHATPEQAAQVARDAKVGYLLLNHIVPTLPALPGLEKVFLGDAPSIFGGPVRVGMDGDFVSLPSGSKDIAVGRRF